MKSTPKGVCDMLPETPGFESRRYMRHYTGVVKIYILIYLLETVNTPVSQQAFSCYQAPRKWSRV